MPDSRISQKVIFWGLGMRHDRAEPARSEAAIRGIGIQGARHCRDATHRCRYRAAARPSIKSPRHTAASTSR